MRLIHLRNSLLVPLVILLGGVILATYVKQQASDNNRKVIEQSLNNRLTQILLDSEAAIRRYEYGIRGLKGSIETVGIDNYDYQTHLKYVESRDYPNEFPGARGFGLIRKVATANLAQFLQEARNERNGNFNLTQLETPKDPLFIIHYIEPEESNQQAVGLDIGSEYFRRQAAMLSATTRATQLTGPITLVQESEQVKHGFLLMHPIFNINKKTSVEELAGWAYAVLSIHSILDLVYAESADFSITISDITTPTPIDFYGDFLAAAQSPYSGVSGDVAVFGRRWLVTLTPNQLFFRQLPLEQPWRDFWQVIAFSSLVALLGLAMSFYTRQRTAELKQRISLAAVIDNASDGVVALNSLFAIENWNKAAEQMFGFISPHSRNQPLINWLSNVMPTDKIIAIYKQVANKQAVTNLNIKYFSPSQDGERYYNLNFSPIHVKDQFAGATLTVHDATAVVSAHHELIQANETLQSDILHKTEELSDQLSFAESILNHTHLAIIKSTPNGNVTLFNQMASELLGYRALDVIDQLNVVSLFNLASFPIAFPDNKIPSSFVETMREYSEQAKFVSLKCNLKHQFGDDVSVQLIIAPLYKSGRLDSLLFIANDITQNRQLSKHLQLIQTAVDSSHDLMLWLTTEGNIFFCNPYAQKNLALHRLKQRSIHINQVIQLEAGEDWHNIVKKVVRDGPLMFEAKFKQTGNFLMPMLVSASVLTVDNEQVIYLAAKNILDIVEKEKELRAALTKAAAASEAKSYFISNMSHEIRTPLNAIGGCLQMLTFKSLNPSDNSNLVVAKQALKSLTATLDDILEFSSFDEQLEVSESDVELDSMLSQIGEDLYSQVRNKPVEVHYLVEQDVPYLIRTDALKLQRVLQSLGSNAIKFTKKGEVVIRIFVIETTENGQIRLGISVKDTGIGIAKKNISAIFEMFNQLNNSSSREFGGLGLGLTIASKYVHMLGGEITVSSQLGRGSEFCCDVWVSPASTNKKVKIPRFNKQISVLLVDDNHTSLQILSDTLTQLHWKVTATSNPNDALSLYESERNHGEPFDVAILDWKMPGTDGWELAEAIRKITPADETPLILMVTAHSKEEMADKFTQNPNLLNGFLTKPVTRMQIFQTYFDAVSASQNWPDSFVSPAQPLAGIRVLVVEDNPTNQQIARTMLEGQGALVNIAVGGLQALSELRNNLVAFDLVLMDIQMPDIDGYETCRRIKSQDRFKTLPIIAMTANVLPSDKQKCFAAGMAGHISKPIEMKELVSTILQTLALDNSDTPLIETIEDKPLLAESVVSYCQSEGIDIQSAMARFNNDESTYCRSLNLFMSDLKLYPEQLEAGELDNTEIKRLFHTLKSTAGALGFASLLEIAHQHELLVSDEADEKLSSDNIALVCQQLQITYKQCQHLNKLLLKPVDTASEQVGHIDYIAAFTQLKQEIQQSNMHALETVLLVLPELKRVSADLADKLSSALDRLKFKEAYIVLTELEKLIGKQDGNE